MKYVQIKNQKASFSFDCRTASDKAKGKIKYFLKQIYY